MANEEKVLLLLNQIGNELQLLWTQMSAPAMILRHLCSSQFLYRSLDELDEQALGNYSALEAYEHERMGEDLIQEVYSSPGRKQ